MSEWRTVALQDVCDDVTVGHVGSMASEYTVDGVPFLRSQNVRVGRLDMRNIKYVSDEFHRHLRKSQLRPGDIVIVRTGEPGAAALIPPLFPELNCADLVIVRSGPQVDPRFLCYSINATARQYVASHLVGAVQQHFNVDSARKLHLRIPSLAAQEIIASVLGTLDDKIAINDRIGEKSRLLAQVRFKVAAQADVRNEYELSSIADLISRGVTPRYSEDSQELIVLNQKCVRDGRVSLGSARYTKREAVPDQKLLRANDVLVNSTGVGTLGRVAIWRGDFQATVDSHVTIVRVDPGKADPVYAGFAMLAEQSHIESLGEGSTGQTELSRTQLGALSLAIPAREDTGQLRSILDSLEARGNAALNESAMLAKLRDTLLPGLMSGQIRVREAERIVGDAT